MAIRKILTDEDPALHKKCHPVTQFDDKLAALLDDMKETLANANGAGLAAPQIGILRRAVIVVNADDEMLELVNPEIISREGEQDGLEGCLSVPGLWGYVLRPMEVKVKAQDRHGNWFEAEGEEIVARCFCHEIEHLDGHVFTEHVDKLYTNEELEELLAQEEEEDKKGKRGHRS
jgi:peptide deformylase